MKKYLLGLTLASVALSSYAVTTDVYEKPDTESTKIGTLNTDENTYNPIFSKDKWTEVVNNKDGSIGWVENDKLKDSVSSEVNFFSDIDDQTGNLLNHHRSMMKYMQSQMADFDKQMQSLQNDTQKAMKFAKNHPNDSKSYFKSVTMHTNDDGTATIVKKTQDGDGNTTEETKTVPTDKLDTVSL